MRLSNKLDLEHSRHPGRLALAAALVAIAGLSVGVSQPARRGAAGGWWTNPQVVERLSLTEKQVREIDEIAFRSGQEMIELRAKKESAQLELRRLLRDDSPDREAIDRVLETLEQAQCAMSTVENRSRVEIALALDADQRERLTSRFEQRREGRNRRMSPDARRQPRERYREEDR